VVHYIIQSSDRTCHVPWGIPYNPNPLLEIAYS
jgi:hypothetical protein